MSRLGNFNQAASAFTSAKTAEAGRDAADVLAALLAEQRTTNALLWAGLTPEQRADYSANRQP